MHTRSRHRASPIGGWPPTRALVAKKGFRIVARYRTAKNKYWLIRLMKLIWIGGSIILFTALNPAIRAAFGNWHLGTAAVIAVGTVLLPVLLTRRQVIQVTETDLVIRGHRDPYDMAMVGAFELRPHRYAQREESRENFTDVWAQRLGLKMPVRHHQIYRQSFHLGFLYKGSWREVCEIYGERRACALRERLQNTVGWLQNRDLTRTQWENELAHIDPQAARRRKRLAERQETREKAHKSRRRGGG